MKIFIMTDLEGVAGVLDIENWCNTQSLHYQKAREFLTKEVNAAIEGFLQGGATEIVVADGHGGDGTVNREILHPKAELMCHWSEDKWGTFNMDDRKFDYIAFIGQHPMAGTIGGHLSHTGNMGVVQQTVNDIVVGEYGDLVLIANELGIRAIFATGCEAFCREAKAFVPGIETVAVKRGTQTTPGNHLPPAAYRKHNAGAIHLHPEEARSRIKAGAYRAIERASKEDFGFAIERPKPPYTRIRIYRGNDQYPPRVFKQTHPTSLFELHHVSYTFQELEINPADQNLRKLLGRMITW